MLHRAAAIVTVLLGIAATGGSASAADVYVDLTALGTLNTPTLSLGVLDITADSGVAPALVSVLNFNGLGVVGGSANSMTDGSETLHFRFEAAVKNARFHVGVANNLDADAFVGECFIEAFVGDVSLGVQHVHDVVWHEVSAMFGGVAITGFDVRADVDGNRIDALSYSTNWDNLGSALAGVTGTPALSGKGTLLPGDTVTLALSNAKAGSTTLFVIGLAKINVPFKGGVLVPAISAPLGLSFVLPTDGAGTLGLGGVWPAGIPAGTLFFFQHWIVDASGPAGFSASNALRATAP